jgi:Protein of unknown function (DUF4231)
MGMSDKFPGRLRPGRGGAATRRIDRLASALVDQWSDHPDAQEYLRFQWGERVLMAQVVSRRAGQTFHLARWLVVIGATTVPTLIAVGARTHGTVATVTQVVAVVLSLLVAIAASALQVQMGQRWRLFNQLEAELEHAGWQLYQRRGEYADGTLDQRFAAFVDRVEKVVLAYQTGYSAQMERLERVQGSAGTPDPLTPDWHWP